MNPYKLVAGANITLGHAVGYPYDKITITAGEVGEGCTGLELIEEAGQLGWRLVGRNPANYGDIGLGAVDISLATSPAGRGALGSYSYAEGLNTKAEGYASHAEGELTVTGPTAIGAHAEGYSTIADEYAAHAEGIGGTAEGHYSHCEGHNGRATGVASHCEGTLCHAEQNYSHAEGGSTHSIGIYSHSEGWGAYAYGNQSHAEGQQTIALNENSHAQGRFNVGTSTETIHEVGIGTHATTDRRNAFEIYTDGRVRAPELTIVLHDDPSSLTTKEYVDSAGYSAKFSSLAIADLNDTTTPSVLTVEETSDRLISNYQTTGADHVFTLPAAHAQGKIIFVVGDEFQVDLEPVSGTAFYLNGALMSADEHIQNTSDTIGDTIEGVVVNVNGTLTWLFSSTSSNWVEETP